MLAASSLHSSRNSKSHHKHTSLGTREVPKWITPEFMFRGMFLQDAAKKKKKKAKSSFKIVLVLYKFGKHCLP